MIRVRSTLLACIFLLFALAVARPGAAQTVSQTTCGGTNGISTCLTNGFLQDLTVDCTQAAPAGLVSTALAKITDRDGPNRITLSGTCTAGFNITGFNRLTLQGPATLTRGINIINSRNIQLRSLVFDFAGTSNFVGLGGSQVNFDGITVKNSQNMGVSVGGSGLGFSGSPSLITANACVGIDVGSGSQLNLSNATISNNGAGQNCGSQKDGVQVHNGGSISLSTQTVVNNAVVDALLDISGNGGAGINLNGSGVLTTFAETGTIPIHIHDNVDVGVALFGTASADFEGQLLFEGNDQTPQPPFPSSQIIAAGDAFLSIGEGAVVHGGLAAAFNAFVIVGNGGPTTITGGVLLNQGAVGALAGANSIDTLTCDASSWANNLDNASVIGTNTCPTSGPVGPAGPAGPQGPVGPQGPPGSTSLTGSVFTANGSPGFLAAFGDTTSLGNSGLFDNGGRMGIGTTAPRDFMHVQFTNTNGGLTGFAVQNLGNTNTSYSGMLFYDQNGALGQFQGFNNVTHEYRINNIAAGGSINFMLGGSSKFAVASSGNIGLGTTTPATRLQVVGDIRLGTGGNNGCVQAFDGSAVAGACSSDMRLKQNIRPLGMVLDKLVALRPVSYRWRQGEHEEYQFGPGRTMGLMAQQVEQLFPGMVDEDARGYKTVNYSELPLLMLEALRELKAENDALRADLDAQRQQLQAALEKLKGGAR